MQARMPLLALALLGLVLPAGCTRPFYLKWADRQTYAIIDERVMFPQYDIGRRQVDPAPSSRLADPNNPVRPPKPPDDLAAAKFMARPGGFKGGRRWDKYGTINYIEPPGWEQALQLDESGTLKLDQDKAVEVALNNSREYQTALEAVYLQALALTLNRWDFALHWFGTNATNYTHFGAGGFPGETNTLNVNSQLGFSRNLAAGGQLLVDFANSLVWEFTGGSSMISSNIAVTLMQPLLRNFGRRVRLESLTQAERDTLYAVRDFARFRKQLWANVAVESGGYLDLLLALQTVRNAQSNLKRQEEAFRLYEALFPRKATLIEVGQTYQSFLASRQGVVDAQASLGLALDNFKLRLGLPPRLPVELDDALLRDFMLTDPSLDQLRDTLEAFQRDRLKELDAPPTAETLVGHFVTLLKYADGLPAAVQKVTSDVDRFGRQLERPARPGDDPEQRVRARAAFEKLSKQFPEIMADLAKLAAKLDQHRAGVTEPTRKAAWETLNTDVKVFIAVVDTILTVQTEARIYLIELPEVQIEEAGTLAFAKDNRLDLQNRLGLVTDAWRQMWVAANQLRTDLNVVGTANIGTDPNSHKPFNFAASGSTYTVGLQIGGPLNRLAERNVYRASLITYQRAKRAYVDLSDQIERDVRNDLRQLNRLRVGFEISRQTLLSAAQQVDNSRQLLFAPAALRSANDTTTLNLLQGLSSLLNARNTLAMNYINFEQQRIQLLLDLEALQLDQRGFPTDDSTRTASISAPASGPGAMLGSPLANPPAPELAPPPRPVP